MKGSKETRSRNWTIVVYPESLPSDWISILNGQNIEYVISPLHDSDKNGAEEEKKAHHHVLLLFGGVKSFDQVKEVCSSLKCPAPQRVHSVKSLVRYFLHLDHPDKHQYNKADLVVYGGVDINDLLRPSTSERYALIADMMDFVDEQGITEFTQLLMYARKERREDWFPCLCDNSTYLLNMYIRSNRFCQITQHDNSDEKSKD